MKSMIAAFASLPSLAVACSLNIGFHPQAPFQFDVYHGDFYATTGGANVDIMRAIAGRSGCEIELTNLLKQPAFAQQTNAYIGQAGQFSSHSLVLYELPYELVSSHALPTDQQDIRLGVAAEQVPQQWLNQFQSVTVSDNWQQALADGEVDAVIWHAFDAQLPEQTLVRQPVTSLSPRAASLYYDASVPAEVRSQVSASFGEASDNIDFALTRHQLRVHDR